MSKIWKWVAVFCVIIFVLGLVLIAVSYATGGSLQRLMATTDITDMTKFVSREELEDIVTRILGVIQ